jgi:ubiquinone/menaquinone biosynthesis C-methylase UbiE
MSPTSIRRLLAASAFLVLSVAALPEQRADVRVETSRLIELLGIGPQSTVADIGAGSGEVTIEMARQLGPAARVYSTDVNPRTVQALEALVRKQALSNVVVRAGKYDATGLPDASCDAVFIRHVYHHFANPEAMNASILRTLKPGGRIAVMDFAPDAPPSKPVPPPQRGSGDTHGVTTDSVVSELTAAGFTILKVDPTWPGGLYLVLARK